MTFPLQIRPCNYSERVVVVQGRYSWWLSAWQLWGIDCKLFTISLALCSNVSKPHACIMARRSSPAECVAVLSLTSDASIYTRRGHCGCIAFLAVALWANALLQHQPPTRPESHQCTLRRNQARCVEHQLSSPSPDTTVSQAPPPIIISSFIVLCRRNSYQILSLEAAAYRFDCGTLGLIPVNFGAQALGCDSSPRHAAFFCAFISPMCHGIYIEAKLGAFRSQIYASLPSQCLTGINTTRVCMTDLSTPAHLKTIARESKPEY